MGIERGAFHPKLEKSIKEEGGYVYEPGRVASVSPSERKPVQHPGVRGGKFWIDANGQVRYGEKTIYDVSYLNDIMPKLSDVELRKLKVILEQAHDNTNALNIPQRKYLFSMFRAADREEKSRFDRGGVRGGVYYVTKEGQVVYGVRSPEIGRSFGETTNYGTIKGMMSEFDRDKRLIIRNKIEDLYAQGKVSEQFLTNVDNAVQDLMDAGEDMSFIENVITTSQTNPAKKIKSLRKLVAEGHDVRSGQGIDQIIIDGMTYTYSILEGPQVIKSPVSQIATGTGIKDVRTAVPKIEHTQPKTSEDVYAYITTDGEFYYASDVTPVQITKSAYHPGLPLIKSGEFARGHQARAQRDVYARAIEKKNPDIRSPYAVATAAIQRGAKPRTEKAKKEIKKEFKSQVAAKKASERRSGK